MAAVLALAAILGLWQSAEKNDQPLVSATDPTHLSCTVWTGKSWTTPAARSARTPQKQSSKGFVAYAEVKVAVNGEDCENTTTVYVASSPTEKFRAVYLKSPSESGGNGIRLIGWSPNGNQLLAEVTVWAYETDTGYGHIPVIYDASTNSTKEISALGKALDQFFGADCEFEQSVQNWRNDQQLVIKVSRTPLSDEPKLLAYDLQSESLQPTQPSPRSAK
jgi:hypothetical protein